MRANHLRLAILFTALHLSGCWEPKTHDALQPDGASPGGPWAVCEDALARGVGNDTCTFMGGCAVGDASDHYEGTYCLSSARALVRFEYDVSFAEPLTGDRVTASAAGGGCVAVQEPAGGELDLVHTFCVPDALLPPAAGDPLAGLDTVVLETEVDCEALLEDDAARPGNACSGSRICALRIPTGEIGGLDPTLVWCHASRLRYATPFEIGLP